MFAVICHDKPNQGAARDAHREAHMAYIKGFAAKIVSGGTLRDEANTASIGAILVIDVPDRASAEAFIANDPFAKAGIYESAVVRPYKKVF